MKKRYRIATIYGDVLMSLDGDEDAIRIVKLLIQYGVDVKKIEKI